MRKALVKVRIIGLAILIVIAIIRLGSVSAKETTFKTESGETIEVIYSVPEGKGKPPAIIYNHGTFIRKLGYFEASSRAMM
jgi:hypothetical protein